MRGRAARGGWVEEEEEGRRLVMTLHENETETGEDGRQRGARGMKGRESDRRVVGKGSGWVEVEKPLRAKAERRQVPP
jgi:hypothetical protein